MDEQQHYGHFRSKLYAMIRKQNCWWAYIWFFNQAIALPLISGNVLGAVILVALYDHYYFCLCRGVPLILWFITIGILTAPPFGYKGVPNMRTRGQWPYRRAWDNISSITYHFWLHIWNQQPQLPCPLEVIWWPLRPCQPPNDLRGHIWLQIWTQ